MLTVICTLNWRSLAMVWRQRDQAISCADRSAPDAATTSGGAPPMIARYAAAAHSATPRRQCPTLRWAAQVSAHLHRAPSEIPGREPAILRQLLRYAQDWAHKSPR